MNVLLSCTALALLTALTAAQQYDRVVIGVHYRSTADEAVKFITRQLYPAFLTLNTQDMHIGLRPKRVVLQMVPYEDVANDAFTKNATGPARRSHALLSTKIHACAVANLRDDWKQLSYLGCVMLEGYERSAECAETTCFDDSLMVSCVNTIDGDLLLMANINKTRQLGVTLTSAPVVTFNGAYKSEEQYMARLNLLALVCDKFEGHFERYCEVPRAKQTMTHDNFGTGYYYPEKRRCSFP